MFILIRFSSLFSQYLVDLTKNYNRLVTPMAIRFVIQPLGHFV